MTLDRADLAWLRALAGELAAASEQSRGGRVFFDREWIDEVVVALRVLAESQKKKVAG